MVFQNRIERIFLYGFNTHYGHITKGVGRLIKTDFGKETKLRKEYREFLSWYEAWQPDEIDGIECASMIDEDYYMSDEE